MVLPLFVLLCHGYCPQQNIKSIKGVVMYRNKEMECWFINIKNETFCDQGVNKVVLAHF